MISPNYYHPRNTVKAYFGAKIPHYLKKPPTVTLSAFTTNVQENDSLYSIAGKLFGEDSMYLWTIIADNNYLRPINEWQAGDFIKLPTVVLNDSEITNMSYEPSN